NHSIGFIYRVHPVSLELPLADCGEGIVGIADFNRAVQVPVLGGTQRRIEDSSIFVNRNGSGHRVADNNRNRALVRNALADVAVAVPVGQRKPRSGRSIPAHGRVVDDVVLAIVVVGQSTVDAVWQRSGSGGQWPGVVDGFVTLVIRWRWTRWILGRVQSNRRGDDRVAWLVRAGVGHLVANAEDRR